MSSHEPDAKRFKSISTTSQMHSVQHNAHVHHTRCEPIPSRYVPDRFTPKRHLFSNGPAGNDSR
eukprot:4599638-Prorocentrum_lima.AAC.1